MSAWVPKKNVDPYMADIKSPSDTGRASRGSYTYADIPVSVHKKSVHQERARAHAPLVSGRIGLAPSRTKTVLVVAGGTFLLGGVLLGSLWVFERNFARTLEQEFAEFQSAFQDVGLTEVGADDTRIRAAQEALQALSKERKEPLAAIGASLAQNLIPFARNSTEAFSRLQSFTEGIFSFSSEMEGARRQAISYLLSQDGTAFVGKVKKLQQLVGRIEDDSGRLSAIMASLRGVLGAETPASLPLQIDLRRARAFLDAAVPWLESKKEHHIAVFFGNAAELRPGGGFIGSYADVIFEGGAVRNINVHDINEPDRLVTNRTVPPRPLQLIVRNWRAADANWFLDFSVSAEKVLAFLEQSDFYKKQGVTFDVAIALTPKAVEDILRVTGPIPVPSAKVTLESDTFLRTLQEIVQNEQARGASNTKTALADAVRSMLEKFAALKDEEKARFATIATEWFQKKDVVVYAREKSFAEFFESYGFAGKVFATDKNLRGDYLGIARASIGGDKSDLVMQERITVENTISAEGMVRDRVVIERTHQAKKSDPWWYRTTNQNYIQLLVPESAVLTWAEGASEKKIAARAEYASVAYTTDPDVAALENTRKVEEEFPLVEQFTSEGKQIFASWLRVPMGETKRLIMEYERRLPRSLAAGDRYTFTFDKQPGSRATYAFSVGAPAGFIWQETGSSLAKLNTDDPDGRVTLDLTLAKGLQK